MPDEPQSQPKPNEIRYRQARRIGPAAVVLSLVIVAGIALVIYRVAFAPSPNWVKEAVLAADFAEPSGIVFHPTRQTLFLVGDEGELREMSTEGTRINSGGFPGLDLEGVTVDPATGLLYALVEGENAIVEFDPDSFTPLRRFSIGEKYEGRLLIPRGEGGIEGIAFVPDPGGGGSFFVVNRAPAATGQQAEKGASFIAELAVPIEANGRAPAEAAITDAVPCRVADLTDLCWWDAERVFVAPSERTSSLVELDVAGTVLRSLPLPGRHQEGVAFDSQGYCYIAQDSGGVLKLALRDPGR